MVLFASFMKRRDVRKEEETCRLGWFPNSGSSSKEETRKDRKNLSKTFSDKFKHAITQCRGEEIMRRGGGSPPASQLAELIWVSCHHRKLRRAKVPVQKQQTNKKQKSPKGNQKPVTRECMGLRKCTSSPCM